MGASTSSSSEDPPRAARASLIDRIDQWLEDPLRLPSTAVIDEDDEEEESLAVRMEGGRRFLTPERGGWSPGADLALRGWTRDSETLERAVKETDALASTESVCSAGLTGLRLGFGLHVLGPAEAEPDWASLASSKKVLVTVSGTVGTRVCSRGPRVTTLRGFVFLSLALREIAAIVASWRAATEGRPRRAFVSEQRDEQQECPICLDRVCDVVLSCSHALCRPCETEWLVGEGRGTCPFCRSKQTEKEDWVLHEDSSLPEGFSGDPSASSRSLDWSWRVGEERRDAEEGLKRGLLLVKRVLRFVKNLPTWEVFERAAALERNFFAARAAQREEAERASSRSRHPKRRDALTRWIRGQLDVLESATGPREDDARVRACPMCTTVMRVPDAAEGSTRLLCPACECIVVVDALGTPSLPFLVQALREVDRYVEASV